MNWLILGLIIILSLIIDYKISNSIDEEYSKYILYSKKAYDDDQTVGCLTSIILATIIVCGTVFGIMFFIGWIYNLISGLV